MTQNFPNTRQFQQFGTMNCSDYFYHRLYKQSIYKILFDCETIYAKIFEKYSELETDVLLIY
jgi:hypothetical protein